MDTNVKRREWVKTVAIIFLAVLLVLTFFSNTIMNASLPEVATQQVTQGTINAKIRASGTIAANETYNVKLYADEKDRERQVQGRAGGQCRRCAVCARGAGVGRAEAGEDRS